MAELSGPAAEGAVAQEEAPADGGAERSTEDVRTIHRLTVESRLGPLDAPDYFTHFADVDVDEATLISALDESGIAGLSAQELTSVPWEHLEAAFLRGEQAGEMERFSAFECPDDNADHCRGTRAFGEFIRTSNEIQALHMELVGAAFGTRSSGAAQAERAADEEAALQERFPDSYVRPLYLDLIYDPSQQGAPTAVLVQSDNTLGPSDAAVRVRTLAVYAITLGAHTHRRDHSPLVELQCRSASVVIEDASGGSWSASAAGDAAVPTLVEQVADHVAAAASDPGASASGGRSGR